MKIAVLFLLTVIYFDSAGQNGTGGKLPGDTTAALRKSVVLPGGNRQATNGSGTVGASGNAGADSINRVQNAVGNNAIRTNNGVNSSIIRGGNDTTFNSNTVSQGGVTTNAGAVDRSGQAQFGQTNWGNSRSTVGESQWTVPPPITASFNKDFPASNSTTWTRNNVDTTVFSARAKTGAQWVRTSYSASGRRLDLRTEYPVLQPPRPVAVYLAKQPASFSVFALYKLQVQGKPEVYEIETTSGKKIYLNNEGMEVNY